MRKEDKKRKRRCLRCRLRCCCCCCVRPPDSEGEEDDEEEGMEGVDDDGKEAKEETLVIIGEDKEVHRQLEDQRLKRRRRNDKINQIMEIQVLFLLVRLSLQRRTGAGGGRAFPPEFCVRQQYVSDKK